MSEEASGKDRQDYDVAAISYIWVMSIFVWLFRRDSDFVQFHAKQAMVLFLLSVIFWFIPVIGKFSEVFWAALMLWGFYQAARGVRYEFPLIADLVKGNLDISRIKEKIMGVGDMIKKAPDARSEDDAERKDRKGRLDQEAEKLREADKM